MMSFMKGYLVGRGDCSECGRSVVRTSVRSCGRLKNWHLLFPWLAFSI